MPKDARRVHKKPIPLIGGLAIFYGFIISVMCFAVIDYETMGILIGSVIMVTVGVIDDMRDLNAKVKLIFQIIAALVVVYFGVDMEYVANPFSRWFGAPYINLGMWSIPLTVIWIVGVTNAVNLIDGLDGLAAGVTSIAAMSLMVLCIMTGSTTAVGLTAALAGACLGFLPRNFNPAEIFMGDTGSTFLGFVLAVTSILGVFKGYALLALIVSVLCVGLPVFDTICAMLRRMAKNQPIMQADRGHLHHKLIDHGFSQRQAVLIMYTISLLLGLLAIFISFKDSGTIVVMALTVIVLCFIIYYFNAHIRNKQDHDDK